MSKKFLIFSILLLSQHCGVSLGREERDDDSPFFGTVGKGIISVAAGAAAVAAAPGVLAAAEFTAAGVIAGSIAAFVQAGIGNVVAGSTFAALQSASAAGLGPAASYIVGSVGGSLAVSAVDKVVSSKDEK